MSFLEYGDRRYKIKEVNNLQAMVSDEISNGQGG